MSSRRVANRDADRFSQDGVARRGFLRQVERTKAADVRECVRKWIANTPKEGS